ncbi:MAG: ATP-binding protein [Steroidobacteraceae bacterium]
MSFVSELEGRLRRGEHLALYGPRGSGKSRVMAALEARIMREGVPCALSPSTTSLGDITRVLERAYPGVATLDVARRSARARLVRAADQRFGVLLLDHLSDVSNAMVACLRRLHGGIVGALSAVDVEDELDRQRMKPWRYGAMSVRMPLLPDSRLGRLLRTRFASLGLPPLDAALERHLVRAARGRPGWIVECTELARDARYWGEHGLLGSVLCVDTEVAVRYHALECLRPELDTAGVSRQPA